MLTPEIHPLTPERLDDYLRFFAGDAFSDNPYWDGCYCAYYHFQGEPQEWNPNHKEANRAAATALIQTSQLHGLLAYADSRVVGWCHAAPRAAIPNIERYFKYRADPAEAVGAIVCFVIAPPYRRQGVARSLLTAACDQFRRQGLAYAEAYPFKRPRSASLDYHGSFAMYLKAGFTTICELESLTVVRKRL